MKELIMRPATRSISILRPVTSTVIPTQAELTTATGTNAESLFFETPATPQFRVLGQPPTLASLVIPPSIPLYVRKGCLTSLHGSASISMAYEWIGFWSSLLRYGTLKPAMYHRLVSSAQFDALVAPNFLSNRLGPRLGLSSSPFRTLCLLNLDGLSDWNVWGKDSIVAFEDNTSLELRPPAFGFSKSPFSSQYTTLKGRGNVLLSGSGSVYTIQLKDASDEIILRSEHLLAISGSSLLDIDEAVTETALGQPAKQGGKAAEEQREFDIKMFFQISSEIVSAVWNRTKQIYSYVMNGPTKFLKIKGPRNLLVQSSYNVYLPASSKSAGPAIGEPMALTYKPSKNYLSYVSVSKDGEVEFQSTADFQDTVTRIQNLAKRK
ncbi:hypothetical protein HG536_0B04130 [Torulaspora globosa]|uniref:Altered inheritance of mitochondria protein 24, mitochondrial n=1 Tax=Torulaspora globosa TaxID=48254 RepID=A0A7G3ZDG3_9SACH|nr:uncharacterized protein HG536_0B04130 [Torulaspora globosa]QLL31549.1 hypothetical protein HG536_0B04130 [Torulaspora globosa]